MEKAKRKPKQQNNRPVRRDPAEQSGFFRLEARARFKNGRN